MASSATTGPSDGLSVLGSVGSEDERSGAIADHIAAMAKGLAHPARVAILMQFADGRRKIVRDLVSSCDLAPSTVSEHLRILREAGLVTSRRDGPRVWYDRNVLTLHELSQLVEALADDLANQ